MKLANCATNGTPYLSHPSLPQVDMEEVYIREGDAPLRRLAQACELQQQQEQQSSSSSSSSEALRAALNGVVWTRSMRRLYTLLDRCLQHKEPVLLVGETGTGKTTVCQVQRKERREV